MFEEREWRERSDVFGGISDLVWLTLVFFVLVGIVRSLGWTPGG